MLYEVITIATYPEIDSSWAPNEKVSLEVAIGASFAGARSMVAMKHVGLNVAADPLMTMSYIGVRGGLAVITSYSIHYTKLYDGNVGRVAGPQSGSLIRDAATLARGGM